MVIVSIINQKGGVGKTTTAVNLAAGLAEQGKSVLLIDLDPQANATTGVGCQPMADKAINRVLVSEIPVDQAILDTDIKGVWLIPSHISLAKRLTDLDARTYREELLKRALMPVKERFDYVLLDPPPALNVLSINAIAASERLIVPIKSDKYSHDGLGDLFDTIQEVSAGGPPMPYRLLITHYDARNSRTNEAVEDALSEYRQANRVYDVRIRKNEALTQAQMEGKSIFQFDQKSAGAEDYATLTKQLMDANE
jgi:chromosome partitioning protein